VGCAVAGVVAASVSIGESAADNVIGKENPNWGEFAIDTALSYPGGKAIGYARDLSRPLRPLARTDDILEAAVKRRPFQALEGRPFALPKATRVPAIERATRNVAARGPGSALRSPTTVAQQRYRATVGGLGVGTQRGLDNRLGQTASK